MRQIDQEIIEATDELKHDVKLTTAIITGSKTTVVEVSPGNLVRSPKKMIEDCYAETQREIQDRFGSLEQAVGDATKSADECVTLAAECRSSESTATSAASQATASARAAENYSGDAAQAKIAAEQSASAAAGSQQTASSAATASSNAAGASVEAKNNAENAAAECLDSKNTAAGSASTATDKATLATRQADRSKAEADRAKTEADGVLKDAVRKPENLADLPDKAIGRKNLGVYSKSETDSKIDSKDSLPDQTGADGKFLGSDGADASWKDISIPAGVPVGGIIAHYGSSAPMGWLGLTKGSKISKADYPGLWSFLQEQVQPQLTNFDVNISDPAFNTTGLYHTNTNKYAIITGQADNVYRTERVKASTTNPDTNFICEFVLVSGSTPFPTTVVNVTLYQSLTDIPLPNDECFLPDAANNFIKGYEPSGTRPMGTFEQDAIRNIAGSYDSAYGQFDNPVVNPIGTYSIERAGSEQNLTAQAGRGQPNRINFNSSRIVPTGPENVPKNLNCLWIIKAYDNIIDPEQVYAKAIIDQVNSNSSDLLSVNSELDQIGYALLDFGTVNVNSRYVKPNPFGNNVSVLVLAEVQNNGKFADTGWIYSSGSNGAFGVKGSYLENEGIVVQTANVRLGDLPSTTGTANNNSLLMTAPCRVHVWRVKG